MDEVRGLKIGDIVTFEFCRKTGYIYRGRTKDKDKARVFEIFGGGAKLITPPIWPEGDIKIIGSIETKRQDASE